MGNSAADKFTEHLGRVPVCQQERIQELAEDCDNEYYLSAIGVPLGDRARAIRGLSRIRKWLSEFENLRLVVECPACLQENDRQLHLQQAAIGEIVRAWEVQE